MIIIKNPIGYNTYLRPTYTLINETSLDFLFFTMIVEMGFTRQKIQH